MSNEKNGNASQSDRKTSSEDTPKKQEKIAEDTLNPSAPEDANVTPGSVPARG